MSITVFICLVWTFSPATGLMTRAERLAQRRQSKAYQRAMSNISLQFISEFLAEQPPTSLTVRDPVRDFNPSGLRDESHFTLLWLLPGILISFTTLAIYLTACLQEHRDHKLKTTEQTVSLMV